MQKLNILPKHFARKVLVVINLYDHKESGMSDKSDFPYLHGFSKKEQDRLRQQAAFSEYKIYEGLNLSDIKSMIEIGSGVGAQTEILLRRFPEMKITCIDANDNQIAACKDNLSQHSFAQGRYQIQKGDAQKLDFQSNQFDGAFLCWVLEHIPEPAKVLSEARRVLRPGGRIYVTEVLNSSFFLDPYSPNVWEYWMKFNDYQYENAGDPFVGAKLGNLLLSMGFTDVKTEVKTWHFDNRHPDKRKETIEFWTELLMSGKDQLIKEKVISKDLADNCYKELRSVANDPNAVFFYSFIQASATVI